MSVIEIECEICKHPRLAGINNDLIKGFPFHRICERNQLTYTAKLAKQLIKHRQSHIETPSMALAKHMLHEEAVQLKNTAVEVNTELDKIDMIMLDIFQTIEHAETIDEKHKLFKNYADMVKRKYELLGMLNKMSGKDLQDELKRASLTEVIKRVSKEVGEQKIKKIRRGAMSTELLESFLLQDPHINAMFQELSKDVEEEDAIESD